MCVLQIASSTSVRDTMESGKTIKHEAGVGFTSLSMRNMKETLTTVPSLMEKASTCAKEKPSEECSSTASCQLVCARMIKTDACTSILENSTQTSMNMDRVSSRLCLHLEKLSAKKEW